VLRRSRAFWMHLFVPDEGDPEGVDYRILCVDP
jgi:hypothetical protein